MSYLTSIKLSNFFLLFLLFVLVLVVAYNGLQKIFCDSSQIFGRQEVKDDTIDWINMETGNTSRSEEHIGPDYTDLQSVNYLSDGRFLNATFWLPSLKDLTSLNGYPTNKQVYYGMLFDSDFNNDTGYQGIDYQVEIKWNDTSKKWMRSFNEFSANGHTRNITLIEDNHMNFFDEKNKYIIIHADLKPMLFPDRYRVFFYSYSLHDKLYLLDAIRWVYIPPPEFTLSTIPKIVTMTAGENENIEINVNSTTGFQPMVHLDATNIPKNIKMKFTNSTLPISSYGFASTTLTLSSETFTHTGPRTFFILANISFLNSTFYSPIVNPETHKNSILTVTGKDLKKQIPIIVTITDPIPLSDHLKNWLTDWFNPLTGTWTTITTIATGILGWRIWRKRNT
jgi:hypothetical protein